MDSFHHKEDFKKKYDIIGKPIGYGINTKVYKGKNKNNGEERAIKVIDLYGIQDMFEKTEANPKEKFNEYINNLLKEIKIMKTCGENNNNSVIFYESFETEAEFAIVMELCDDCLTKYKKDRTFNSEEIKDILKQLNNTFKIMIDNKIVHRDLKPDNILIKNENGNRIIKLSDYGISKIEKFTHLKTNVGTDFYMAPEIMTDSNEFYSNKCDLWSLGIIIYELCFKKRPYSGLNQPAVLSQINQAGKNNFEKTGDEKLDDLISQLLEKNPDKRISWDDYFNHRFFGKEIKIIHNENENKIDIVGEINDISEMFHDCPNLKNVTLLYKKNSKIEKKLQLFVDKTKCKIITEDEKIKNIFNL